MNASSDRRALFRYLALSVPLFLALQALVVVVHEFTHATMAWALGVQPTPMTVVWGNPMMMTGWDEGVAYQRLFAQGLGVRAAVIGICPLVMHSLVVWAAMALMRARAVMRRKWLVNTLFLLAAANFMELVAYVYMRAFAHNGDIGNFNHGLGLSPWWVFIPGSAALSVALWRYFHRALPRVQALFAPQNPTLQYAIALMAAAIVFLWGSGIRVLAYVDGPQRLFGLIGAVLFLLVAMVFRPRPSSAPAPA